MEGVNTLVDIDVDENIYGNNDRIDGTLVPLSGHFLFLDLESVENFSEK